MHGFEENTERYEVTSSQSYIPKAQPINNIVTGAVKRGQIRAWLPGTSCRAQPSSRDLDDLQRHSPVAPSRIHNNTYGATKPNRTDQSSRDRVGKDTITEQTKISAATYGIRVDGTSTAWSDRLHASASETA